MRRFFCFVIFVSLVAVAPMASANILPATPPPTFGGLSQFPTSASGYGIVMDNLSDGRFVLYDGDKVKVQTAVGQDSWQEVASGYTGDATFIAISPDGHTALLGGGYNGKIYSIDLSAPQDYAPSADLITGVSNYWAAFLDATHLFIEATPNWGSSEMQLADLSGPTPVLRKVLDKPNHYGATFALSPNHDLLYATAGDSGEVRVFQVGMLLNAFAMNSPLTWTDGTLLGTYNKGGVSGVSTNGTLIAGSFENSVQFIDSTTGMVVGQIDPDLSQYNGYTPFYNDITHSVYVVSTVWQGFTPIFSAYNSLQEYESLPAFGGIGLAAVAAGIWLVSRRRLAVYQ